MPEKEIAKRGGAVRWRTLKLPSDRYLHVAVTRGKGPRGGRTVAGEPHKPANPPGEEMEARGSITEEQARERFGEVIETRNNREIRRHHTELLSGKPITEYIVTDANTHYFIANSLLLESARAVADAKYDYIERQAAR